MFEYLNKISDHIYLNGFLIIENFLEESYYQALRQQAIDLLNNNYFKTAGVGRGLQYQQQQQIRNDKIYWLDETSTHEAEKYYWQKMQMLAQQLNRELFLGLQTFETHYAIYSPGNFYKKHTDQFKNNPSRQISCVYYLNGEWEEKFGGQLRLYDRHDNWIEDIFPIGNRLLCFQSDLPHEVCITHETRYSLAGWFKR